MLLIIIMLVFICIGFDHEQFMSTTVDIIRSTTVMNHLASNTDIINSTSTIIDITDNTVRAYSSIISSINNHASNIDIMNNIVTSSMTNSITDDNITEAAEHTNNKPTKIVVILCFVFGGLLGLSLVVCIVGFLMKRRYNKRKNDIKRHNFTSVVFNPFTQR